MGNIVKTAKCRFCGQMTQIEADEELTAAQAEEQATMTCNCTDAVEYQKEKQRKEKAMQNVAALFGDVYKRQGNNTGQEMRRGDCEDSQGSSRGDLHRRTGKGHVEPPWRRESLYFAE